MKKYHAGEIVLLLFPFADATGAKRRAGMTDSGAYSFTNPELTDEPAVMVNQRVQMRSP